MLILVVKLAVYERLEENCSGRQLLTIVSVIYFKHFFMYFFDDYEINFEKEIFLSKLLI